MVSKRRLLGLAASLALVAGLVPIGALPAVAADLYFSEIHYDNTGTDVGEAIEVTGPAGTDVTGWSIVLYNGNGGAVYTTTVLAGAIPSVGAFTVDYPTNGIQNGSPDGMALVDDTGVVVEFLSYEGVFIAVGGPADGMSSVDIGVSETGSEPIGLSLQKVAGVWQPPAVSNFAPPLGPVGPDCSTPDPIAISFVQGDGDVTPCSGQTVTVEGVVVGDYEGPSPTLRGFYVEEEAVDQDADPLTSEGIFVFNGSNDSVSLGDVVRVAGTVSEFQGQTQISAQTVTVVGAGASVAPASVRLPFPSSDYLERFEGMLVRFDQDLFVTEHFQLGRFGQIVVSSGDRLAQPTAVAEPGAAAQAVQAANDLNRLIVDDDLNNQNPDPILFGGSGNPLTASNTLRGGDKLTNVVGVMTYTWGGNGASPNAYRLRPVGDLSDSGLVDGGLVPKFETENKRPKKAPEVGGQLTVASFNVLNYFVTLDIGTQLNCGPSGFPQECRGAETTQEFVRQRTKLLAALSEIDADVVGLIELENTAGAEPLADIVSGLNALTSAGTYDYIDTGTIGTDVIKVGIIYKPEVVTPVGGPAILDSAVDPRFDDDLNRPSLAQSFADHKGDTFTVVVNHLKSKGCTDATGAETDQGDGQGCWNPARVAAAQALADWTASDPTGVGDPDVLVIGDLNSYAKEDPVDALAAAGFVNLVDEFQDPGAYSYVFDGQWGYLDYALASPSLFAQVEDAEDYHINADEPSVLDYNTNFKSAAQIEYLYAPDEFRTSDHDPVLIGLKLKTKKK